MMNELQNSWGGRDLLTPSSVTPLLKQGQLEQVAQDHVQLGF